MTLLLNRVSNRILAVAMAMAITGAPFARVCVVKAQEVNLALKKTVVSDPGLTETSNPQSLTDGVTDEYTGLNKWFPQGAERRGAWVEIDFQEEVSIGSFVIYNGITPEAVPWADRTDFLNQFTIEYYDGRLWNDVPGGNGDGSEKHIVTVSLPESVTARKIRLVASDNQRMDFRLREIEVYASTNPPVQQQELQATPQQQSPQQSIPQQPTPQPSAPQPATPQSSTPQPSTPIASNSGVKVRLNGRDAGFAHQAPEIVKGSTMIPLRSVFEAIGVKIAWDDQLKTVSMSHKDNNMVMSIDQQIYKFNNQFTKMDVAPMLINDRTMIPIQLAEELLDATISWDETSKIIAVATQEIEMEIETPDAVESTSQIVASNVNLALNKAVTAQPGSTDTSNPKSLTDGVTTEYTGLNKWFPQGAERRGAWVEIDLESKVAIGAIVIHNGITVEAVPWSERPDYIGEFKIEYYDGESWKDFPAEGTNGDQQHIITVTPTAPVEASKIKIIASENQALDFRLREIEVFGMADGSK